MTLMTKYELVAMAAGFLLGGIISSIITEKSVEKRKNEEFNKELEKIRLYSESKKTEKDTDGIKDEVSKETPEQKSKFSETSIDYHQVDTHANQYNHVTAVNDEDYVGKYGSHAHPIHLCTFEDACNAPPGWNMEYFKWWSVDDVLTDDDDNPVDFSLIGDACEHFGENPDDPDELYVSNHNTMKIYNIRKYDLSYAEECLGNTSYDEYQEPFREKIAKKGRFEE